MKEEREEREKDGRKERGVKTGRKGGREEDHIPCSFLPFPINI